MDHLRDLLTRGIFLRSEGPDPRKVDTSVEAFHRFALPTVIDGQEMVAFVTVRQDHEGNYLYDGRVLEIEVPADGNLTSTAAESSGPETRQSVIRQAREEVLRDHLEVNSALVMDDAFSVGPARKSSRADHEGATSPATNADPEALRPENY